MMDNFFTQSPQWHLKIGEIHALLERVKISEEQHGDVLRLRKLNRILSIHASTAIEGNILTSRQVQDVVNGKPVLGPPKDIKEVRNVWAAYNLLEELNPYSSGDLLKAHASMTAGLVDESGAYRTCGVVVARRDGTILHQGTVDCRPFIDFMLDATQNSLYKYVDIATETQNGGIEVETRPIDPINDPTKLILDAIMRNPHITYSIL
jgi:Fic family protein